jgi:Putative transposase DNA-binding domain
MATTVYRYAVRARADGALRSSAECRCGDCQPGHTRCAGRDSRRYELPAEVTEQVNLAWQMRQDLITIEHAHEDQVKALWSQIPEIAVVEGQISEAAAQAEEVVHRIRNARSAARGVATSTADAEELRAVRARERAARQKRRALITAHAPALRSQLAAPRDQRSAAVIACRQRYAARGLYWATYNMVVADHSLAVRLVEGQRAQNRPARLRHTRNAGTGTVAVQLQRYTEAVSPGERATIARLSHDGLTPGQIATRLAESGLPRRSARSIGLTLRQIGSGRPAKEQPSADPPRSPRLLASGEGKWRNVFQLRPWMPPEDFSALPLSERRRIARAGQVVLALGRGRAVVVPVVIHRMLPADADVTEATLTITRRAGQWNAAVSVAVRIPDPAPTTRGPVAAIHGGWRKRADGSIRVATWATTTPVQVPDRLKHLVVRLGEQSGEIILPASWLDRAGYPAGVRGIRDTLMAPVLAKTADWLDQHPQELGPAGADVRKWRAAGRLASLAIAWRNEPPAGDDGISLLLEEWRARDRHLWELECHDRDQLTSRRDDAWHQVAAWLSSIAGTIVIDDADLIHLLHRPGDIAETAMPRELQVKARARAAMSAPGRLRQYVVQTARREGLTVRQVEAANLSRTCPHCWQVSDKPPRHFAAAAVVACPYCREAYDQDHSAAALMLIRAAK